MILGVTGPRPYKIPRFDPSEISKRMEKFLNMFDGPKTLISGGALGIDQLWIKVGIKLKLPVIAILPFEGYDGKWDFQTRNEYQKLLRFCQEIIYTCEPGYDINKFRLRNEMIVDKSDFLVAYFVDFSGGTGNCIRYAQSQNKSIFYNSLLDADTI